MTGMSDADGAGVPSGSGRARDLVGRRRQRRVPETGRVHHLGAAPPVMPVLGDGSTPESAEASATRTAAVQLASRTRWELERLLADIEAEMATASAALDFERAAGLRDELARVRAELDRRSAL
jgi:excinuclease UvrABC helicase subunit UvrB